jgi:hypothetical protein
MGSLLGAPSTVAPVRGAADKAQAKTCGYEGGASAGVWRVRANDLDYDGFASPQEVFVGTEPLAVCAPGAWPPDWTGSQTVDLLHILQFKSHFGATDPSDRRYDARHDLNVGSAINILDLLPFKPSF